MFERLKEYKKEYGDCLVPIKYEDDPQLGNWVRNQRQQSTMDDKMKKERHDKLNSIGFVWRVRTYGLSPKLEKQWNDAFKSLKDYKREHGDCLVPHEYESGGRKLGYWVHAQRARHANGKLRPDRKKKLESVGFVWVAGETLTDQKKQWEKMFERLKMYKTKHGDCLVPDMYSEDLQLGKWVSNQRTFRVQLDKNRRQRLESIGFIWNVLEDQWDFMYERLEAYRRGHGDCRVPRMYSEDRQLGEWVSNQRQRCSKLASDRRARLDSIGFVWRVKAKKASLPEVL